MESETLSSRSHRAKNPIPTPSVLIRSEYPTLTRSRQQQSLTCLVTVEMPEGKWQPDIEEIRHMRPGLTETVERTHKHGPSASNSRSHKHVLEPSESAEELERVTEDLHARVDNWHGLDFSRYFPHTDLIASLISRTLTDKCNHRFGKLLLHDTVRVGKDRQSWQELECYLFAEMLICVKEKKTSQNQSAEGDRAPAGRNKCVLKGSIMIKKHLNQIETSTGMSGRTES